MLSMLAILGAVATAHGRPAVDFDSTALLTTTPPHLDQVGGGGSSHDHQRLRRQAPAYTTTAAEAGDDLGDYPLFSAMIIGCVMVPFFSLGCFFLIGSEPRNSRP